MNRLFTHGRNRCLPVLLGIWIGFAGFNVAGCSKQPESSQTGSTTAAATSGAAASVASYGYEIVNTWPHDRHAFTQGLVYVKGVLIESTGLNGRSSLRKVDIETGNIRQSIKLSSEFFGEGAAVIGDRIFQLTWQNQKALVYNLHTLEKIQEFTYAGEGWGLTTDGRELIMSNGSNRLLFVNPQTFETTRVISVYNRAGQPLANLNELEFIEGKIFANIWQTPYVAEIDPADGRLTGIVNFSGLLSPAEYAQGADVLNGIAYDAATKRIFVTGKNWPKLFEVRLK